MATWVKLRNEPTPTYEFTFGVTTVKVRLWRLPEPIFDQDCGRTRKVTHYAKIWFCGCLVHGYDRWCFSAETDEAAQVKALGAVVTYLNSVAGNIERVGKLKLRVRGEKRVSAA